MFTFIKKLKNETNKRNILNLLLTCYHISFDIKLLKIRIDHHYILKQTFRINRTHNQIYIFSLIRKKSLVIKVL